MDEFYLDSELVDLGKDTKVGITLQVNDIAELENRQANFSNTFKTPKSKNNKAIYEHSDVVSSATGKPYEKIPAKYVVDGIELVSNGYCEIKSAGDFYEQTIFYGILDFFSQIKGKKLSDLDLTEFNHTWDLATVFASRTNTDGYIYPLIDFNDDSHLASDPYFEITGRGVDVRTLHPAIFYHTLIRKIFENTTYTLAGDVTLSNKYLNRLFPFQLDKLEYSGNYGLSNNIKVRLNSTLATSSTTGDMLLSPVKFKVESGSGYYDNPNSYDPATGIFTIPNTGAYIFEALTIIQVTNGIPSNTWDYEIEIVKTVGGIDTVLNSYSNSGIGNALEIDTLTTTALILNKGDLAKVIVHVYTNAAPGGSTVSLDATSSFTATIQTSFAFGDEIMMSGVMPDMTQEDLLKSIANQLGIIFIPDNVKRIIYFRQYDELYANIPNAVNMSDKLHEGSEVKVSFREKNYAQKNWLKYKENKTVTVSGLIPEQGRGDGFFTIEDENLELEKTLLTLPFSASDDVTRLNGLSVCRIPKLHAGEMNNQTGLRMVMLNRQDITGGDVVYRDFTPAGSTLQSSTSIPLTYFIDDTKEDSLGFNNLISVDYEKFVNRMMRNYKKIECDFKLSIKDIHNFDFFKPWSIDKFSGFFYVNKINNFVKGRLTSVELIRM